MGFFLSTWCLLYLTVFFLNINHASLFYPVTLVLSGTLLLLGRAMTEEGKNSLYATINYPENIYLYKVDKKNTRKRCGTACLLLNLNIYHTLFQCFYCCFEHVNVCYEVNMNSYMEESSPRVAPSTWGWHKLFLFYKNSFYKNHEAENCPKSKNFVRITPGSTSRDL